MSGFNLSALAVRDRSVTLFLLVAIFIAGLVAFLWLISSKAFVDYTSSGLENPLSYLLLALFYLRSRGVPESEAKELLTQAFLEDAIGDFVDPAVHGALWQRLDVALKAMDQTQT